MGDDQSKPPAPDRLETVAAYAAALAEWKRDRRDRAVRAPALGSRRR